MKTDDNQGKEEGGINSNEIKISCNRIRPKVVK